MEFTGFSALRSVLHSLEGCGRWKEGGGLVFATDGKQGRGFISGYLSLIIGEEGAWGWGTLRMGNRRRCFYEMVLFFLEG